ncbi:MAG: SRPBCC family protein [Gaiellales bacterium]
MRPGIDIKRTFPTAPQAIFDAWTHGDQLAQWFGLPDAQVTATCDARVGGAWQLTMHSPTGQFGFTGTYSAVTAPSHLSYTLQADGQPGVEHCTVDLASHGDGTELRFTQGGDNLTVEQYEQATAGYVVFFERLDALTRVTAN